MSGSYAAVVAGGTEPLTAAQLEMRFARHTLQTGPRGGYSKDLARLGSPSKWRNSCWGYFEAFPVMLDVWEAGMFELGAGSCGELLLLDYSVLGHSKRNGPEDLEHGASLGSSDHALVWMDGRCSRHYVYGCSFAGQSIH